MDKTALIILAGGLGTRVSGANKGLLSFKGKVLIEHLLHNLASTVSSVIISANRDINQYQRYGYPVVPDLIQYTQMGPLAGIASAAQQLPVGIEYIQIVPCDLPLLTANIIETLHKKLVSHVNLDIVYAADPLRQHPIICQMRRHHLSWITTQLASDDKHSMRAIIEPFAHLQVKFNDTEVFTNFNSESMF